MSPPTVAVTGATGFIGWHVAQRFSHQGWKVRAIVRPESTRPVPDGVQRVTAPFEEPALASAFRGADVVVHLAAAIKARTPAEFERSNVAVTSAVARAVEPLGIRLVHASSLGVTGPSDPVDPPTEDTPPHPVNEYGASKARGEAIVRGTSRLDWTILRPTLVYGPRDRLFYPLFRLADRGIFPLVNPAAVYNIIHVDDVARAVEAAATSTAASRQVFFVGHPRQITARQMMVNLALVFDRPFRPLTIPRPLARVVAELGTLASRLGLPAPLDRARWRELQAPGFVCRIDKAREHLGFVAEIGDVDGFTATAAWYRTNGWMK